MRRAFTLIELLVVIGLLAVLLAILLPAIRTARVSFMRVKTTASVRELLTAYTQYHQSNKGALLFGYTPATINGSAVVVSDLRSGHKFGLPIADRYPWRLAPYCANVWAALHSHSELPPLPAAGDSASDAFLKAYTLSLNPTFGVNAVYLGGHRGFLGFAGPNGDAPNTGKHAAFKASEVRRASEIIVFAESQTRNGPFTDPTTGLHFVTPPRANGQQWNVVDQMFVLTSAMITGVPQGRFGPRGVVGFFDGHAELRLPSELTDMRLWAPRATRSDYDFVP
jgi:prepilin-type N-terminal cleavage/methylation domain-containing protein